VRRGGPGCTCRESREGPRAPAAGVCTACLKACSKAQRGCSRGGAPRQLSSAFCGAAGSSACALRVLRRGGLFVVLERPSDRLTRLPSRSTTQTVSSGSITKTGHPRSRPLVLGASAAPSAPGPYDPGHRSSSASGIVSRCRVSRRSLEGAKARGGAARSGWRHGEARPQSARGLGAARVRRVARLGGASAAPHGRAQMFSGIAYRVPQACLQLAWPLVEHDAG
jgi:hypothetical protein